MKNKFIKTLNLGLTGIMLFAVISVSIPENNKIALTTITTNKNISILLQDPPFHTPY